MRYRIFSGGIEINCIESGAEFVAEYCQTNGYTYEAAPLPDPEPAPEPTPETPDSDVWEALDTAYQQGYTEGVNAVE